MKILQMTARVFVCISALAVSVVSATSPAMADDNATGPSMPGEYIVLLKSDGSAAAVAAAAGALAAPEELSMGSRFVRLVLDPTRSPSETIAALKNTPGVGDAQPNFVTSITDYLGRIRFFDDFEPAVILDTSSEYAVAQPGLNNSGLPSAGCADAVVVAVLDTGVDPTHSMLAGRVGTDGYDFVSRDSVPDESMNGLDDNANGVVDEAYGHGTYVAGLVALVAPGSTILPVRVLDSDGSSHTWRVMQGLAWATANGAKVINLSLGGSAWGPVASRQLKAIEAAGHIVVAAAGNDAATSEVSPAAEDGVVGVTAIDGRTGAPATFANRGSWIDVAAPGVRIVSLYPGNRYATWGGTSAATPIASAALALVATQHPTKQADDLISALTSTARPAGLSGLSAYGRIDVAAAVARARTM